MNSLDRWLLAHTLARTVVGGTRLAWRFSTGAPMDGKPRTDAGWISKGTVALTRTGRATPWAYLPRWQRAAWRWGSLATVTGTVYGLRTAPWAVYSIYAAGIGTAGWYFGRRALRVWRLRKHNSAIVIPLYRTLSQALGQEFYPLAGDPERVLHVPVDYADREDATIRFALPVTFSGDAKAQAAISRIFAQKLGIELDGHWSLMGDPYVEYTRKPEPPQSVSYADIVNQVAAAADGDAVIGLGTRGETVAVSLDTETPHIGMSIGTGGGKSSTLRGMIAQYRKQGAEIVIADVGVVSLREFEGVPGITIVTDVPGIWTVVDRIHAEMERRYEEWKRNPAATFRRLIFVLEEANDFYIQSLGYWNEVKDKKDPATPPVFMKMAQFMVKARKVKMHLLGVYQNMDARTVGGGSPVAGPLIRAQFGMRVLARFTPQTWAFLVGTNPRPKSSRHNGRAIVMVGDDMRVTQLTYWTPEEARAVALGDREPVSVTEADVYPRQRQSSDSVTTVTGRPSLRVLPGGATGSDQGIDVSDTGDDGDRDSIEAPDRLYSLAEAAREKIVPLGYGALRQAKSVAKQKGLYFPAGRTIDGQTKYTARELHHWYGNRDVSTGT